MTLTFFFEYNLPPSRLFFTFVNTICPENNLKNCNFLVRTKDTIQSPMINSKIENKNNSEKLFPSHRFNQQSYFNWNSHIEDKANCLSQQKPFQNPVHNLSKDILKVMKANPSSLNTLPYYTKLVIYYHLLYTTNKLSNTLGSYRNNNKKNWWRKNGLVILPLYSHLMRRQSQTIKM